jgi:hypothetical protein
MGGMGAFVRIEKGKEKKAEAAKGKPAVASSSHTLSLHIEFDCNTDCVMIKRRSRRRMKRL